MPKSIVIMNENLRLKDNPALHAAASEGEVIAVYLYDLQGKDLGKNHKWWLKHSLDHLGKKLPLCIRKGDPVKEMRAILKESKAESIFWNDSYDPVVRKQYKQIEKMAVELGVNVAVGEANLLVDPETLCSGSGGHFKVYTPFWRRAKQVIEPSKPLPAPRIKHGPKLASAALPKEDHPTLGKYWKPGEDGAQETFKRFCKSGLAKYGTERDRVDHEGTSRMSPYLRWGEISVREIWHTLKGRSGSGVNTYLGEIGFREFAYYMLFHFPGLGKMNFRSEFNAFPWSSSKLNFEAWCAGETGYPIVDAGMRQLVEMGWMHNRARMIVGSFLTKDLLIDWRKGEKWFWDELVDGDPALNAFNWQWVAGSGVDAAPFFRIFNPTTQGLKFDPNGDYVAKWVPELSEISGKAIHEPWKLDEELDYPEPIIDHDQMRKEALSIFKNLPKAS